MKSELRCHIKRWMYSIFSFHGRSQSKVAANIIRICSKVRSDCENVCMWTVRVLSTANWVCGMTRIFHECQPNGMIITCMKCGTDDRRPNFVWKRNFLVRKMAEPSAEQNTIIIASPLLLQGHSQASRYGSEEFLNVLCARESFRFEGPSTGRKSSNGRSGTFRKGFSNFLIVSGRSRQPNIGFLVTFRS